MIVDELVALRDEMDSAFQKLKDAGDSARYGYAGKKLHDDVENARIAFEIACENKIRAAAAEIHELLEGVGDKTE